MRLSWNEVRARAAAFAEDWKDAAYEKGETQSWSCPVFVGGSSLGTLDLVWSLMVAAPVRAARLGVSTGSSRGGVSSWKPCGGAGRGET